MRKRNCNHLFDTIFWYIIYAFPLLIYLFFVRSNDSAITDFSTFFSNLGFGFATDNIVINGLESLFGVNGALPLFSNQTPFIIFSWFICTFICHLAVDFLLFIPRYCHKLMDSFGERE